MADKVAPPNATVFDCSKFEPADALFWQQKGVELKASEEARIKEASAKWTGVLSAIAGIAAITAVLSSYDELRTLSTPWQAGVVAALLAALGLIIYANFSAFHAEVGNFKEFTATAPNTCNYFMNEPRLRVAAMARSRIAALLGLGLLVAAVIAVGLAPRESTAKSYAAILTTGGMSCGVLQTDANGTVSIVDKTGGTVLLRIGDTVTLSDLIEVSSCGTAT